MSRKLILSLVLIGVSVVVMLLNARESVTLNLAVTDLSMRASFAYLAFMAAGVLSGVLLK